MKHYAIDQWADFTRGMLDDQEHAFMAAHLEGGCPRCGSLWNFTAKLNAACIGLASDSVPESMTRMAFAIFPLPVRGRRDDRLVAIQLQESKRTVKKLPSDQTTAPSRTSYKRASAKEQM